MSSIIYRRRIRQLHRWLGLIVAAQMLAWVAGGLLMSLLHLEAVRGADLAAPTPAMGEAQLSGLLAPSDLALDQTQPIRSVDLALLIDQPVYRVRHAKSAQLFDARSGQQLSPLSSERARAIAEADFLPEAAVLAVDAVTEAQPGVEFRGRALPLWRVRFDDKRNTALYVSAQTGEVVARRNDLWRVFDFVWMLHIMDYSERDRINNPLLNVLAATTLLFVLSGLLMLVSSRWRAGR